MRMSKFEKKFGKYAIENLTLYLIVCYIAGYIIQIIAPTMAAWLTLDPYRILHGQIWRLVTWLLIPPSTLDIFTIIMLFFYYSIGTTLEKTWGTYRYNVYLFMGMLFTIIAAFLFLGVCYVMMPVFPEKVSIGLLSEAMGVICSTYYISISIFLGFAMTYPNVEVLLMFIFPIKMKWLGYADLFMLVLELLVGSLARKFVIGAALLNVFVFYLMTQRRVKMTPKQMKRRGEIRREVKKQSTVTRHKCAICGRTEKDDPELTFRFCSKCNGNYEYCQYHLFTHEHVK